MRRHFSWSVALTALLLLAGVGILLMGASYLLSHGSSEGDIERPWAFFDLYLGLGVIAVAGVIGGEICRRRLRRRRIGKEITVTRATPHFP